ncbi:hypothetical protein SAMN05216576_107247 [Ectopseudomonas chengduensis]|jgi:hypothetical protein|uniref:Uncharacterized protein n=1 Tax=Ectopseudomonas chengduensis TaxID=489632 RepID=A0A1G6Q493_9GAMM|nr:MULTISPECIES: hypothetical protein [Pseudomonas]MBP3062073.1 hypothetical protein [Pseudomonas chengduensis]NNB75365.1 hypothetical protein [Pseudomonas chengduensis]OEO24386.1 hypothetical protein AX279_17100 [Pseudomonas sp. J237]CRN65959.1 hypothetical protein PAERUG_P40_Scotland_4_VIM_2_09_12_04071 [Pseudomonas aeruginosa]SDC87163.1 hypothetical protein SAMN05216576_107247 [Pseudomonas chengduensis]
MKRFEEVPYLLNGADWGKNKVLARTTAGMMLVWLSGGSVWSGMNGTQYTPARLILLQECGGSGRMGKTLHEGGRLSRRLLGLYQAEIEGAMGVGAVGQITLRSTVTL